jgi:hypothetical protein
VVTDVKNNKMHTRVYIGLSIHEDKNPMFYLCLVTPTFYKNKNFCVNRSAYKNAYQILVLVKNFLKK